MLGINFEINLGHIITLIILILGYIVAVFKAWNALRMKIIKVDASIEQLHKEQTELKEDLKDGQKEYINKSDFRAGISEMKAEMYKVLGNRRSSPRE